MPQNPNITATSLHICKLRASRLNTDGTFKVGANSHVVTANPMSIDVKPVIQTGDAKVLTAGCGGVAVSYKQPDSLLRFEFTLVMTTLEPALIELLTGGPLRLDTSTIPVPIGNEFPDQRSTASAPQGGVAIEAWTDAIIGDAPAASPFQYYRWVWPMTFWQMSSFKLENDFLQLALDGYSRGNLNFANAYGDWPVGVSRYGPLGGYFLDSIQPIGVPGYSGGST